MQHRYPRRQEQLRAELQRLQMDLNDYFTEHERTVRVVYEGLRDRLDRLQRAVAYGNGCAPSASGSSNNNNNNNNMNNNNNNNNNNSGDHHHHHHHATPVAHRFAAAAVDGARGAAAVAAVPSTPPGAQRRADCGGPAGSAEWAAPLAAQSAGRTDATPAVSPHRPWPQGAGPQGAGPQELDYRCFEAIHELGDEEDTVRDVMREMGHDGLPSSLYTDDHQQQQQQQQQQQVLSQSQRSASHARPELIPIGTLSAQQNQRLTTSLKVSYASGRPQAVPIPDGVPDDPEKLGIETNAPCKVLVEFKRKRVLQFESKEYVQPGSYVMVGGDRGEDLGLVTYTWCETARAPDGAAAGAKTSVLGVGLSGSTFTRSIGLGTGVVLRSADESSVMQLHSVQSELERRAIDVCSQRVLERGLPMTIVDAEYQFDKKKLTFFYEAQQRMDFRELVRDLYKTFRARIWMEAVEN